MTDVVGFDPRPRVPQPGPHRWRPVGSTPADGGATVAVRYRDRPWSAVLADMVEGVVVTNNLNGAEADSTRSSLWAMLEDAGVAASPRDDESTASRPAGPRLRAVA